MKKLINKGIVFLSTASIVISLIALKNSGKRGPRGIQGPPGPKGDRCLDEVEKLDKKIENINSIIEIKEGSELSKLLIKRRDILKAKKERAILKENHIGTIDTNRYPKWN